MNDAPARNDLLVIRNLTIEYRGNAHSQLAVDDMGFRIAENQFVGVLGESGSGKTTTALAIVRLLPSSAIIASGSIDFRGKDLLQFRERQMQRIRGAEITFLSQEATLALNPVMRAVDQVSEVIRAHTDLSRAECREQAFEILTEFGLTADGHLARAYPHELSGGQKQRLLLAQALAANPRLLIADEPTASLDQGLRTQLYSLLRQLREKRQFSLLFITHNLEDLYALSDRVLIVYAGQVIEQASISQLFREPLHPYARLLLRSIPPERIGDERRKLLPVIPGHGGQLPLTGCSFAPRCPECRPECREKPPREIALSDGRMIRCNLYGE